MILILEGALKCDRNCKYCYQKILHGEGTLNYNKEAIANTVKFLYNRYKDEIVLHGGEPLLLPLQDIEYFLRLSYELSGKSSICTNGLLINEDHIKLFKKYKTSVAVSIDGFPKQNILRCTKEETEKTLENISSLASENIPITIMIVAHKLNYNYIFDFIISMSKIVKHFKINHETLTSYSISPTILYLLWKKLAKLQLLPININIDPINLFISNLLGHEAECFNTLCDPYCTQNAKRILPNGKVANCSVLPIETLYTFKPTYKRYYILEKRDCRNCKYWNYCYGGCAAYFYHKDRYCYAFYKIYDFLADILHINCQFREVFSNEDNIRNLPF
ncbi:MAG: hypothetical protein DRP01_01305 [Archaeoglobales archaeon]|nr:MAG: hypothetical protein DRP01_01305 [Archaeoglobales archaeon]